ncbi:NAD(P)H-dependent oxidoreductase [Aggregatibacter actinomycetemcomitans]|uniref:NAD(P)H-dependent oxidoreductase n=1 Tax=Aggregatibacter actinomycetemcomitans TaxID=714 RepID=UPI0006A74B0A|nr:NAD(P)H-dependent oxidoreductase [Aggregatibacter actinomycetemcomitans]AMQ92473.1 NAD(P)H dehydrogenase [Aggregatibacter actinomycetemcomitans]KOE52481.1 NAD(P)H dehydrogenase [Aggregatibacter actinomycetemcomitans serotype b str. I23C]KOE55446.1 NAD(P)H dehydrogenase [Aggregatibacter actinomycetemcomitans serotype b str. S23A]TYA23896.1 NAD(P)H-dependent oxidoreductase [Aggregatibacter actinomycetemcomitans]TYA27756.1 NAD(P)H-dependent oxidoreductase [Aggregatibacter actinomycetemcomitans
MKNVLIVSGHPDSNHSVANVEILQAVENTLPDVKIRRLDSLYPTYKFDIDAEQSVILEADVIVFQFPFSWYSVPSNEIVNRQSFVYGFAHGSAAKIGGKKLIISTTGAPNEVYQKDGFFKHTVEDYLSQFETFATLCTLDYQALVITCGVSYAGRDEAKVAAQKAMAPDHAARLVAVIDKATA